MVVAYVLFFLLGLGLGYGAPGLYSLLALLAPIAFGVGTAASVGVDGHLVIAFVVGLAVTAAGVLLGKAIDAFVSRRGESSA